MGLMGTLLAALIGGLLVLAAFWLIDSLRRGACVLAGLFCFAVAGMFWAISLALRVVRGMLAPTSPSKSPAQ
jgi:hypothetical protein